MSTKDDDAKQWVAVAAIVIRDARLLTMRRAEGRVGAGLWETVSGRIRPGEDPLVAIAREVLEETGLDVHVRQRPIDVYSALRGTEPMTVIVYRADHLAGEVVMSHEHDATDWLDLEAFADRTTLTRLVAAARRAFELPPV